MMRDYEEVNPAIWHACSGVVTRLSPLLSSTVYYFPQAHVESYNNSASVRALCAKLPAIECRISSLKFLADHATDEVFAHIKLKPMQPGEETGESSSIPDVRTVEKLDAGCIKRLESCDVISGVCSVPAQCVGVEDIFQRQDVTVSMRDIHNRVWTFQYTYDHFSQCHNLGGRWGEFVNAKQLKTGDCLLFLKTRDGGLTLGIRRGVVPLTPSSDCGFHYNIKSAAAGDRIQRTGKGLCSVEAIGEALGNALQRRQFEVVYYPCVGISQLIYDSKEVEDSKSTNWGLGMTVRKTSFVKDQLTRVSQRGIIIRISDSSLTSWKHIQVAWDGEEGKVEKFENPWELTPTKEITLMGKNVVVPLKRPFDMI